MDSHEQIATGLEGFANQLELLADQLELLDALRELYDFAKRTWHYRHDPNVKMTVDNAAKLLNRLEPKTPGLRNPHTGPT